MNSIGKNISERRREAGITQEQLAEKLGISAQAVSKWENDLSEPDASTLLTLSGIFGCTVDDLLRGAAKPKIENNVDVKPEDRILMLSVETGDTRVKLKVPAGLILKGDPSALGEPLKGALSDKLDFIREMIEKGTVGNIIDVSQDDTIVTVSIE